MACSANGIEINNKLLEVTKKNILENQLKIDLIYNRLKDNDCCPICYRLFNEIIDNNIYISSTCCNNKICEGCINDWYNIHDTVIFKHILNVGYDLDMKVDGTEINVPLEENDIVIFCFDNYDDNYFLTIKNNIKNLNLHTFIYNENIEDVKVKEKCLYLEKNKKKVIKEILKEIL